ncbi:MAG: ATP-binding cassette domain-containing protein [Propionibacteriaceae bacterium]|nr:ATP-binding cassette domain-containing protein [Propionibacteriaceae bacterium]
MRQLDVAYVGHTFGESWLFKDVNATLSGGSITAIIGPSGSGKTTLLTILAGSLSPSCGQVTRLGVSRVVWVRQNPLGVARRTALDHVCFPLLVQGFSRHEANLEARALLALFGVGGIAASDFADLSGGEAQRVLLAQAVACQPDLLLIDEPTAQLDRVAAAAVIACVQNCARDGAIVLIATHDQSISHICGQRIDLRQRQDKQVFCDSGPEGAPL